MTFINLQLRPKWHRLQGNFLENVLILIVCVGSVCFLRVPNRFFGIRDLAYFKAGFRDFEEKGGRDSGL